MEKNKKESKIYGWFNFFDFNIKKNKKNIKIQENDEKILRCRKYKIILTDIEQKQINIWLNNCIDMYNITNEYIKNNIIKDKSFKEIKNFTTKQINYLFNFRNIRTKNLIKEKKEIINKNKINSHTLDYVIKLVCEMYKSAISNLKENNITKFNLKNLTYEKRKKNLVIEQSSFTGKQKESGFFTSILKNKNISVINNYDNKNILLNKTEINHNCILQYDNIKNEYYIFIPTEKNKKDIINRNEKCGIDLGIRTFATIYSTSEIIEIGDNVKDNLYKNYKKLDKIQELKDKNLVSDKVYHKVINKYNDKIKNKVKDLHYKLAVFLCKKYDLIHIGKISTSSIKSCSDNKNKVMKRLINSLSFYKFMEILKHKAEEYQTNVVFINEYNTSKECSSCGNIKNDLGSNKIYNCNICGMKNDRDINAAVNIYNRKK